MRNVWQMAVASSVLFMACNGAHGATPTPTPAAAIVIVMDIDSTTSYAHWGQHALMSLATSLPSLVQPGTPGYTVYVRKIDANSWQPEASLGTVVIPAVDPAPAPLGRCPNEYDPVRCAQRKWEYQVSVNAYNVNLQSIREGVQHSADELAQTVLMPVDGTDVNGALQAADFLLNSAPAGAERWYIIASDLEDCVGLSSV